MPLIGAAVGLLLAAAPAAVQAQIAAHFSGAVVTLGPNFNTPWGVAVDSAGNIYLADYGNGFNDGFVYQMSPNCTTYAANFGTCASFNKLGGTFYHPGGLKVDPSGNVWVAEAGNNAVKKIPPGCGGSSCVISMGGGYETPSDVALDGQGNFYVTNYLGNEDLTPNLAEYPPNCTASAYNSGGCSGTPVGGYNNFIAPRAWWWTQAATPMSSLSRICRWSSYLPAALGPIFVSPPRSTASTVPMPWQWMRAATFMSRMMPLQRCMKRVPIAITPPIAPPSC